MSREVDILAHYLDMKKLQFEMLMLARDGVEDEATLLEKDIAIDLALYASSISPFVTGSLSASHTVSEMGDFSLVHISEHTTNPFSDEDPWQYGPEVHAMGGHRAFYTRTVAEASDDVVERHGDAFMGRIEARF